MEELIVAVVLPSLNEEKTILETCKSLGFNREAITRSGPNAFLFIVDNESTDKTLELARQLQLDSPPGSVIIGHEEERGYVPPRHKGNTLVTEFANQRGLSHSDILLLQVDADTQYEKGYIESMRSASKALGPNLLLEGLAEFPPEFRDSFPEYVDSCRNTDERTLSILDTLVPGDIICPDAVCGYRLSDYFYWGGTQENTSTLGMKYMQKQPASICGPSLAVRARPLLRKLGPSLPNVRSSVGRPENLQQRGSREKLPGWLCGINSFLKDLT